MNPTLSRFLPDITPAISTLLRIQYMEQLLDDHPEAAPSILLAHRKLLASFGKYSTTDQLHALVFLRTRH